jgi:hypothetical protein
LFVENRLVPALLEAVIDLPTQADEEDGAHSQERENGDFFHDRVEEVRVVEHLRGDVDHHRAALVHLDVGCAAAKELHKGGAFIHERDFDCFVLEGQRKH